MSDVENPLTIGLPETVVPEPCSVVIFGSCGDLSRRKLLPALYNLAVDGVLPAKTAVVGFARRDHSDDSFRSFSKECVDKYSRREIGQESWIDFERFLYYHEGSLDDLDAYVELRKRLEEIELEHGIPGNRIYYLSVPPGLFSKCVELLRESGLVNDPDADGPFTRVIVEKPIGYDLESARQVNDTLASVFSEDQTYRIDHYLGKETVQNILVMRFGNAIFEPLWNQKYIDHDELPCC